MSNPESTRGRRLPPEAERARRVAYAEQMYATFAESGRASTRQLGAARDSLNMCRTAPDRQRAAAALQQLHALAAPEALRATTTLAAGVSPGQ